MLTSAKLPFGKTLDGAECIESKSGSAKWTWQVAAGKCPLRSEPTLDMTWTSAPLFTAPHHIRGRELSSLALFCVKLLLAEPRVVCWAPLRLVKRAVRHRAEVCVAKAEPRWGRVVESRRGRSNTTTQSNRAWISPVFTTPDRTF